MVSGMTSVAGWTVLKACPAASTWIGGTRLAPARWRSPPPAGPASPGPRSGRGFRPLPAGVEFVLEVLIDGRPLNVVDAVLVTGGAVVRVEVGVRVCGDGGD